MTYWITWVLNIFFGPSLWTVFLLLDEQDQYSCQISGSFFGSRSSKSLSDICSLNLARLSIGYFLEGYLLWELGTLEPKAVEWETWIFQVGHWEGWWANSLLTSPFGLRPMFSIMFIAPMILDFGWKPHLQVGCLIPAGSHFQDSISSCLSAPYQQLKGGASYDWTCGLDVYVLTVTHSATEWLSWFEMMWYMILSWWIKHFTTLSRLCG